MDGVRVDEEHVEDHARAGEQRHGAHSIRSNSTPSLRGSEGGVLGHTQEMSGGHRANSQTAAQSTDSSRSQI